MEGIEIKIGFIGLGIVGKPMARSLLKVGQEVNLIIIMLLNFPHVRTVVMRENSILKGVNKGTILIGMSSIAPLEFQENEKDSARKEPKAVDGSLSGHNISSPLPLTEAVMKMMKLLDLYLIHKISEGLVNSVVFGKHCIDCYN